MGRGQKAQRAGKSSAVKGCVTPPPWLHPSPCACTCLSPPPTPQRPRDVHSCGHRCTLLYIWSYFHSRSFNRHRVLNRSPTVTVYSKVLTSKACSCRGHRLCWWPFHMLGVTTAVGFYTADILGISRLFPDPWIFFGCLLFTLTYFYILALFDRRQRVK